MRVRGLKLCVFGVILNRNNVAPHAGAWIETSHLCGLCSQTHVAPHAGAWIETRYPVVSIVPNESHPMRVRGLKQAIKEFNADFDGVAPHAGAWIETFGKPRK